MTIFRIAAAGLALTIGALGSVHAQTVKMSTSMGDIVLKLDAAKAPKTVANFVQYARDGHYDGTVFHRVIDGFMIQGGGFTPDMKQKPTRAPIPLESRNGLNNERGTIAMARTMDPNSATAQFFINVKDNASLDGSGGRDGYAVFGKVVSGMDVVDKIKNTHTGNKKDAQGMVHQDVPTEPVIIKQVTVEK
ncbi:peptidylprolyl isomerase [Eleftheria terrae]|uniref:peptidylprolyl isomerase n=1 Tax=Eleftheria terrae TaxID=1597781 RepID=UPI003F4DF713